MFVAFVVWSRGLLNANCVIIEVIGCNDSSGISQFYFSVCLLQLCPQGSVLWQFLSLMVNEFAAAAQLALSSGVSSNSAGGLFICFLFNIICLIKFKAGMSLGIPNFNVFCLTSSQSFIFDVTRISISFLYLRVLLLLLAVQADGNFHSLWQNAYSLKGNNNENVAKENREYYLLSITESGVLLWSRVERTSQVGSMRRMCQLWVGLCASDFQHVTSGCKFTRSCLAARLLLHQECREYSSAGYHQITAVLVYTCIVLAEMMLWYAVWESQVCWFITISQLFHYFGWGVGWGKVFSNLSTFKSLSFKE